MTAHITYTWEDFVYLLRDRLTTRRIAVMNNPAATVSISAALSPSSGRQLLILEPAALETPGHLDAAEADPICTFEAADWFLFLAHATACPCSGLDRGLVTETESMRELLTMLGDGSQEEFNTLAGKALVRELDGAWPSEWFRRTREAAADWHATGLYVPY